MTAPRTFPASVDVVVVGSGPTGAAYARVLSERAPGATIAVLEVGPAVTDPPGGHVKNIPDLDDRLAAQRASEGNHPHTATREQAAQKDPRKRTVRPGTHLLPEGFQQPGEDGIPALAMSSNVGGMGAHWTCACPRPGGAERPGFVPGLDELLDEAARLLGVEEDPFADAPFSDEVRRRLAAEFDPARSADRHVRSMPLAVRTHADGSLTWSGADVVFGEETRANPAATLYPEAQVRRVLVEDGRAVGVVVRDRRTGTDHEVRARFVVVAADAVRTPQLLFASGVRPEALGRYLNDQPQMVFAVRLTGVAADDRDPRGASGIVQQSGVSWVPYTDEDPFHGQVMQLDASPVPIVGDVPAPGTVVGLGWFCGKDLQASDRVAFADGDLDEDGMPAPRIHYTLTAADHETLDRARASVRRAAAALGDPLGDEPFVLPSGASLHYQGSTRMGPADDGTSVCGPTSEVWGVEGLYVAGNGVIPTPIACNPTLTSVALAVAGARDIARRLSTP